MAAVTQINEPSILLRNLVSVMSFLLGLEYNWAKITLGICGARNLRETACSPYWIDLLVPVRDNRENCCTTISHICQVGNGICLPLVGMPPFVYIPQHPPYLAYRVQLYTHLEYGNTVICIRYALHKPAKSPAASQSI